MGGRGGSTNLIFVDIVWFVPGMFLEVWGGQGRFLEVQKALFIIVFIKKTCFLYKNIKLRPKMVTKQAPGPLFWLLRARIESSRRILEAGIGYKAQILQKQGFIARLYFFRAKKKTVFGLFPDKVHWSL